MAIKKVKLPNNTVVDINDPRIPGVDSTPTSGSTNVVTSGGVKTALDEATVTESTVSGWGFTKNTGTLTGVSFNGTTAPVSGGVASISVTIPAAPGTLNTTATTEQSTRASEALSGSITLHKISKTGSYSDLSNTPTIDSALSSQSSNAIMNSAVDGEFVKVSYIGDVVETVDPIEPEPEPEPVIVIGGGGIEAITFNGTSVPVNESTKTAAISVPIAELIGGMNRDNVSGIGGLSITNTFGTFPTISTPGTYIVSTRLRSTTQSFTLAVNFGTTYTISTSNGYAYDERAITISSSATWAGSITKVNSGTGCEVRIYRATDYKVENLGRVAITNSYSDLYDKPTIPSAVTESTVSGWGFTKNAGTVTQVKVGTTEYNPSSGVVSLPAYPTTLPASDVSAWAKASTKPTYTASEVGALPSTTSIPTESTVSGWGFTKNTGTLTGVTFNGTSATVNNGVAAITATIPTESTVSGWGFTKNSGTITGITMNGSSKGTSGTVNLGTVVTAETDPVFSASAAHGISSTDISNWNAKQKAITVSSSEPTSSQGSNGDIWIVI